MGKDNGKLIEEIGLLKKRVAELELSNELSENIIDGARDPLIVLDGDLKVLTANNSFYDTFRVKPDETIGRFIYDLGDRQWNIPKLRTLLEDIIPHQSSFDNLLIEHNFPSLGKRLIVLNARRIPRPPVKPKKILLSMEDITEMDRIKQLFEKMTENGIFSKLVRDRDKVILELHEEVNVLLARLDEKLKYKNST